MSTAANYRSNITKAREMLEDNEDGLTLRELIKATGMPYVSAYKAVVRLPRVYVDRWIPDLEVWKWMPVYCVADDEPPEDTPKPEFTVKKYLRSRGEAHV